MRILAVLVCLLGPVALWAQDAARQITVTGVGQVTAVPDMATISLGVSAQRDTARAAMDDTSEVMRAVLSRLEGFDIDPRDIQTSGLSLRPDFRARPNDGPPQIESYRASNDLTLNIRDLDTLGQVLDAVLEDGVNSLNRLSFGLQDDQAALNQARELAVQNARDKAELFARASGAQLGRVLTISEIQYGGSMPLAGFARSTAEAVPVSAGETTVGAQVSIVYALEE